MKRLVLLSLVLLMFIAGCGEGTHGMEGETSTTKKPNEQLFSSSNPTTTVHTHIWSEATCMNPKTCSCGATAGSSLGHQYSLATCTSPKICVRCGAVEGVELGHDYAEANCNAPQTCIRCGHTYGEPMGHKYTDNVCVRCGIVDPTSFANLYDMKMFESELAEKKTGLYDSVGNYYAESIHVGAEGPIGSKWENEGKAVYYLGGQYKTLTGTVAYEDYYLDADWKISSPVNMYIYADDVLVYSKEGVSKKSEPFDISVNINNCRYLEIRMTCNSPDLCYLILSQFVVER